MQIVLDTNVLVAGLRSSQGASSWVLTRLGQDDRFQINISVPLLLEYEEVLKRADTCPTLTLEDVDDVLDWICSVANSREIHFLWRPILSDPTDDMLLELAIRSRAGRIVTHNVRHFVGEVERFGIRAITPKEFMKELR